MAPSLMCSPYQGTVKRHRELAWAQTVASIPTGCIHIDLQFSNGTGRRQAGTDDLTDVFVISTQHGGI